MKSDKQERLTHLRTFNSSRKMYSINLKNLKKAHKTIGLFAIVNSKM